MLCQYKFQCDRQYHLVHGISPTGRFGHYISDNTAYNMSFKQFQRNNEPHICGGYTAARQLEQEDLDVWAKVLALPGTGAELAAKGTPTLVQTAVVSGLKFKFAFEDGSTVIVWRSWRHDISIVKQ